MTVYLDLFMLINFFVDFFLLLGANKLSGFPAEWKRMACGALFGSIYACVCMFPNCRFMGNLLWRFVFLALTGCVAFGCSRSAVKRTGLFLLLSLAMGGVAVGIGRSDVWMLLLSALVVWILCGIGFGGSVGGREFVRLSVPLENTCVSFVALKDSGNSLRDPVSGESVIVVSPEYAVKLTGLTLDQIKNPLETVAQGILPGGKLIPYRTVGRPVGMLLAKRFSGVRIGEEKRSVILAFATEAFGEGVIYQALAGGMV